MQTKKFSVILPVKSTTSIYFSWRTTHHLRDWSRQSPIRQSVSNWDSSKSIRIRLNDVCSDAESSIIEDRVKSRFVETFTTSGIRERLSGCPVATQEWLLSRRAYMRWSNFPSTEPKTREELIISMALFHWPLHSSHYSVLSPDRTSIIDSASIPGFTAETVDKRQQ